MPVVWSTRSGGFLTIAQVDESLLRGEARAADKAQLGIFQQCEECRQAVRSVCPIDLDSKMNVSETTTDQSSNYFRCPVQSDKGRATIRIGRRKAVATIQETSIDGFTVLVSPKDAPKLTVGRTWVLEYDGTRHEIHPQWFFNSPDGHVQMGLRRVKDLTEPEPIRNSWLARIGGKHYEDPSNAAVVFGGFVLFLFAMMASPGLGERLGTADRIQDTFEWAVEGANATLNKWI
jgi:hypothetical protein